MKAGVIGLGLIGGSLALELRRLGWHVTGTDAIEAHAASAHRRRLVDAVSSWQEMTTNCDLLVLAMPVDAIATLLPALLDRAKDGQAVIDLGSTKSGIVSKVAGHPRRGQYVACHPMAGTEFSGPGAAKEGLFTGKFMVICNREESDGPAVKLAEGLFGQMGMRVVDYHAVEHDMHAAFVSHISHISSFALALTVLDKEADDKAIFQLAAGGFTSTVRLAKSAPHTWVPIFRQNRQHLLDVLDAHMDHLAAFREALDNNDGEALHSLIAKANAINRIIK